MLKILLLLLLKHKCLPFIISAAASIVDCFKSAFLYALIIITRLHHCRQYYQEDELVLQQFLAIIYFRLRVRRLQHTQQEIDKFPGKAPRPGRKIHSVSDHYER